MASNTTTRRWEKGTLLVGFAALAAAVFAAHTAPAEGYELSIYGATPLAFWAGVAVALAVSLGVGLSGTSRTATRLGLSLGGLSVFSIVAIPVLRGYHFYGQGDSMTHLGWAKDIAAGDLSVLNFLYPGTHTISVIISDVTGLSLRYSLLLTVVAFTAAFFVFVPLAVRAITADGRAVVVAALASFLLLPVNGISVFNMLHPTSQAILFSPLVVYLAVRYLTSEGGQNAVFGFGTSVGALLAVASVSIVFVHPQQAANVLLVFGSIVAVQVVYRFFRPNHVISRQRAMYAQFGLLAATFLYWSPRHERASSSLTTLTTRLVSGGGGATEIAQRAGSLNQLGPGIETLFFKLFLVSVVFCALAGVLALSSLFGRFDDAPDTAAVGKYLSVALVPLGMLFVGFLVTSYAQLHFRELGFIMVVVTILGAVAFTRGIDRLATVFSSPTVHALAGVAFAVMLVLSVPTVFNSPYMYQPSSHVTETQMSGFETAFDQRGDVTFTGIRSSGDRYADGILGVEAAKETDFTVPAIYQRRDMNATGGNFTADHIYREFDDSHYLPVTTSDRLRETRLYDGFRFPAYGFRSLDATPRIERVQSNGAFRLYLLDKGA